MLALLYGLNGLGWLLWYVLPTGHSPNFFWGFFALAVILVLLGVLAGVIAYRVLRTSSAAGADDGDRRGAQDPRHGRVPRGGHALMPPSAPPRRSADRSSPTAPSSRCRSIACAARSSRSPTGAAQMRAHKREVVIGAAVAGFVVGGGIAAFSGLLRRRR